MNFRCVASLSDRARLVALAVAVFPVHALADGAASTTTSAAPATAGATAVAGTAAGAAAQQPSTLGMLMPFALMFGVIYFLMIRPQQKRMKEQQSLLSSLKDGDEVLTNSGFLGKITGIADKVVTLELSQNVRVKMLKSQINQVVKGQVKDLNPQT
jgi:preprotein translocase subunit YajC